MALQDIVDGKDDSGSDSDDEREQEDGEKEALADTAMFVLDKSLGRVFKSYRAQLEGRQWNVCEVWL